MPIRWERNISNGIKSISRDPDIREFDMQHEQWLSGGTIHRPGACGY